MSERDSPAVDLVESDSVPESAPPERRKWIAALKKELVGGDLLCQHPIDSRDVRVDVLRKVGAGDGGRDAGAAEAELEGERGEWRAVALAERFETGDLRTGPVVRLLVDEFAGPSGARREDAAG